MRNTLLSLLAALGIAFLPMATDAQAAHKKRPAVAKKNAPAKRPAAKAPAKARAKHSAGVAIPEGPHDLAVQSASALVLDQSTGAILFEKNPNAVVPIASITKLMTAMVALDAQPSLAEVLTVGEEDVDTLKGTRSRLKVGTQLSREEMLRLALMSSENRAASALSRHYPGGREAFVAAMNRKARDLSLNDTRFQDPTGLTAANVSSARDLGKLVEAAQRYPLIREFSTSGEREVEVNGRPQMFRNTNSLVRSPTWEIGLSKTGYISEAGKCLVMQAWLAGKPTIIVLLDSLGKLTRVGDANRIKRWVESAGVAGRQSTG
ncbi:MAG TPA: D-alanyl-D-alanine endopeptidase [Rhodocyclaceae bacterium]|nr:D-alanyl-D-alanine endopeptidase [Rhodocyclaceae bacterium]HNH34923.1 D-alanyl-D-alanine endopeptidase [Rhodocyclaceae bacterium]